MNGAYMALISYHPSLSNKIIGGYRLFLIADITTAIDINNSPKINITAREWLPLLLQRWNWLIFDACWRCCCRRGVEAQSCCYAWYVALHTTLICTGAFWQYCVFLYNVLMHYSEKHARRFAQVHPVLFWRWQIGLLGSLEPADDIVLLTLLWALVRAPMLEQNTLDWCPRNYVCAFLYNVATGVPSTKCTAGL